MHSTDPLDVLREAGALRATIGALLVSLVLVVLLMAILIPGPGPR